MKPMMPSLEEIERFERENPTMNIRAKKGATVIFTGKNGEDYELEQAKKILTVGAEYTVERTDVGGWRTEVFLEEVFGESFNSVMFRDAKGETECQS